MFEPSTDDLFTLSIGLELNSCFIIRSWSIASGDEAKSKSYKYRQNTEWYYQLSSYFYCENTNPNKMKTIAVFALIIAAALAAPADPKGAEIVKYENDNIGVDGYKFA